MTIKNGSVISNDPGGAIVNRATLTLTDCTFTGNSSAGDAGVLQNFGGTVTMTNCTASQNTATSNGGVMSSNGTITVSGGTYYYCAPCS